MPPALVLLIGAVVTAVLPARVRRWVPIAAFGVVFVQLEWLIPLHTEVEWHWLSFNLTPLRVDEISQPFADVFALLGFAGGIFAFHVRDRGQQVAVLLYGASAIGVVLAGDLVTIIVAWELMAVGSAYLVFAGGMPNSRGAGMRYLMVHVVGGSFFLAGILWHIAETGSMDLIEFRGGTAEWLMFIGIAINAAIPPMHAWLPDAYPNASVTGMVFLSGFTTKSAVYVLARGFLGWELLIFVGVFMALYGMVYAVMATDVRRLLAYHIVSQVGFMIAGLGVGGEEALEAVASHAFTHVLYKALLVMGVGAVVYATGKSKMTDLGGLARRMPWVLVLYMVGALSISAFPLFAGFASKPLVNPVVKGESEFLAFGLYIASVGTFLHTGLKLPYFTFFGPRRAQPVEIIRRIPSTMYIGMTIVAVLCIAIGLFPGWLYSQLHFDIHPERYTVANVVHALELLTFTAIGFWALRSWLKPHDHIFLDTDWFYRKAGAPVRRLIQQPLEWPFTISGRAVSWIVRIVGNLTITPETGWAGMLERTPLGRRDGTLAAASWLSRPPLGVVLTAVFVTFAVVLVIAQAWI
ncbi:MAG: Na(+)/H(+) antiporter subunit D [Chloroflexi bacterium]|nr:Na(+)/H(+) antiporter subunit D [Chloroflexota bacterium]